jgi:hypothetical protein
LDLNTTLEKSFSVDGHECDDVVASRSIFCKRHLTVYEPYCKRWVQLSVNEANSIKGVDIDFGYLYHDIVSDEKRIQFHVDCWNRITRDQQQQEQSEELALFNEKKPSPQPVFVSPHRQDL